MHVPFWRALYVDDRMTGMLEKHHPCTMKCAVQSVVSVQFNPVVFV